jgi:hypothetical protein
MTFVKSADIFQKFCDIPLAAICDVPNNATILLRATLAASNSPPSIALGIAI